MKPKTINDLPISKKFLVLYMLGVFLPILLLSVYLLTNTTSEIRSRERQNARQSLDRVYSTLDNQFATCVTLGNAMASDRELTSLMKRKYARPDEYYSTYYLDLRPMVSKYVYAFGADVSNVQFYLNNPTMASGGYFLNMREAENAEWLPQAKNGVSVVQYTQHRFSASDMLQMSMVRASDKGAAPEYILKIDLNMECVHRAIRSEQNYLDVYLVSPDGVAVSYPGSLQDGSVSKPLLTLPEDIDFSRGFSSSTAMSGWRLLAKMKTEDMNRSIRSAVLIGAGLSAVFSLLAGALCVMMSNSMSVRSRRLLNHMDSTTNDHFDTVKQYSGSDEIGELTEHFNAMSERMEQLIHNIYVLELRQKNLELEHVRAELKYLQAQIDPHFLFNTLNAILVLCVRNGYMELADVIRALAKILRRMIDTSRDTIPLSEEIEFVKMALLIEQFRFQDKLRYEVDITDEIRACPVPVMSVQALVENACKHGVQHIHGQGLITISARADGDYLLIDVSDNGAGIAPDEMKRINESLHSKSDMESGIGLQNIYRRLVLHYGEQAELTLSDNHGAGTTAEIRIPYKQKGGDAACSK